MLRIRLKENFLIWWKKQTNRTNQTTFKKDSVWVLIWVAEQTSWKMQIQHFAYFLAFIANYALSRKYAQHFPAWGWQTKVCRSVLIPTNGSMFTFSISSVYSMLRNDIVKFLIMIVNRQIISSSINHYWNRLSVVSNNFFPEQEIHMSSAQIQFW